MIPKIEKNVPPPLDAGAGRRKYPFNDMEVGDSFLVVVNGVPREATDKRVRAGAINASRKLGRKFVVRAVDEGVRCWRIE